jgi:hypothetical protein
MFHVEQRVCTGDAVLRCYVRTARCVDVQDPSGFTGHQECSTWNIRSVEGPVGWATHEPDKDY